MNTRAVHGLLLAACAALALSAAGGEGDWDVSLKDVPRLAGETDDAGRIQRGVDAAGAGGVLYLPKGLYDVSRTIWVTNGASVLLHKSATVRAVAQMPYVFQIERANRYAGRKVGEGYDQNVFLKGGHIDGNGLASCVFLQHYFHFTLRDTTYVNGYPYGLHVGNKGCEIVGDNLYFRVKKSGLAGNVALFSEGNDSYFSHIVVVDYTVGLRTTGGANAFDHYHVWGGPIPPVAPGRLPEMLENSICFDLGGHMNVLRDSYADTGAIGFKVGGWGQQVVGCWFLNNTHFGLKDITVVKQDAASVDALIADCCFRASGPETKLYEGPGAVKWRDMVYRGFREDIELPAEIVTGRICACATADEWEYAGDTLRFASAAGEFKEKGTARSLEVSVPRKLVAKRFPEAGPGKALKIRIRATDDATKRLELTVSQGVRTWGEIFEITPEWQDLEIPFERLKFFEHWSKSPLNPGEKLDARKINVVRFMYGNWISGGTADRAHGFEVASVRIVGR